MTEQGKIGDKFTIIHGLTELYYHTVPSELDSITISPERQAIFSYLARIGSERFHEFIVDILVQAEGHKLLDITNGPGDEKQDILTQTPTGHRHLTQCKHTINYEDHYSGDELDLLFGACCRKNCPQGLFVTNSDLTPQGKRYITDKEYARADFVPKEILPNIDYWNSAKIWDRISKNTSILNKWFSGMGQTHGMRKFYFDMTFLRLPRGDNYPIKWVDIAKSLEAKTQVNRLNEGKIIEVKLNDNLSFFLSDSVISDLSLGVRFVNPQTESKMVNIPLSSLRIEIVVADKVGQYDPNVFLDSVVKLIGDTALSKLPVDEWWYIATTIPQAFIFMHDLAQPQSTPVSEAESYVRVGDYTIIERQWVLPTGSEFEQSREEGKGSLNWLHKPSGVEVSLLLEQRSNPIEAYQMYAHQLRALKRISYYEFHAVRDASQEIIDLVRRLVEPKWLVLLSDKNLLLWAFPPAEEEQKIKELDSILLRRGVIVWHVPPREKTKILKLIDISPTVLEWSIISSESDLTTPILLNRRITWLTKCVQMPMPKQEKTWLELIKFKAEYEVKFGFDYLHGNKQATISGREIPGILFDITSIRGSKMLDITFDGANMCVNLRVRDKSLESFSDLFTRYTDEFQCLVEKLVELVVKFEGTNNL